MERAREHNILLPQRTARFRRDRVIATPVDSKNGSVIPIATSLQLSNGYRHQLRAGDAFLMLQRVIEHWAVKVFEGKIDAPRTIQDNSETVPSAELVSLFNEAVKTCCSVPLFTPIIAGMSEKGELDRLTRGGSDGGEIVMIIPVGSVKPFFLSASLFSDGNLTAGPGQYYPDRNLFYTIVVAMASMQALEDRGVDFEVGASAQQAKALGDQSSRSDFKADPLTLVLSYTGFDKLMRILSQRTLEHIEQMTGDTSENQQSEMKVVRNTIVRNLASSEKKKRFFSSVLKRSIGAGVAAMHAHNVSGSGTVPVLSYTGSFDVTQADFLTFPAVTFTRFQNCGTLTSLSKPHPKPTTGQWAMFRTNGVQYNMGDKWFALGYNHVQAIISMYVFYTRAGIYQRRRATSTWHAYAGELDALNGIHILSIAPRLENGLDLIDPDRMIRSNAL